MHSMALHHLQPVCGASMMAAPQQPVPPSTARFTKYCAKGEPFKLSFFPNFHLSCRRSHMREPAVVNDASSEHASKLMVVHHPTLRPCIAGVSTATAASCVEHSPTHQLMRPKSCGSAVC